MLAFYHAELMQQALNTLSSATSAMPTCMSTSFRGPQPSLKLVGN